MVTDSFHLPRSAMSFQWASAHNMQFVTADSDLTWGDIPQGLLVAETFKIWANGLRAPVYSLAGVFGIPPSARHWIVE